MFGALAGGALGGLGGWGYGIAYANKVAGQFIAGTLIAGAGIAAATDSLDSFAGGLTGSLVGMGIGQLMRDPTQTTTVKQTTTANEVLEKEIAASVGNKPKLIDSSDMTLEFGDINEVRFLKLKTEVYGAVGEPSTALLKAGVSTSALEFKTISPYTEALVSFDKLTVAGGLSRAGTLGISGEISAEVINAKTVLQLGGFGGTKFTLESSAGWGAKAAGSLVVGSKGGEVTVGAGFGPTGSMKLRWEAQ